MNNKLEQCKPEDIIILGENVKKLYNYMVKITTQTNNRLPKNHKLSVKTRRLCNDIGQLKSDLEDVFLKSIANKLKDPLNCFYGEQKAELKNENELICN